MAHIWVSHVTHMNETCHTNEWVMPHIWRSHVTHMNASCHTFAWVMSHTWTSHVTHMHVSRHTHWLPEREWVMSHIGMSHGTHRSESLHTHERVMSHISLSHATQNDHMETLSAGVVSKMPEFGCEVDSFTWPKEGMLNNQKMAFIFFHHLRGGYGE